MRKNIPYSLLFRGLYPRVHDQDLDSYKWHENYVFTYVERDVRSLLNIKNPRTFEQFLLQDYGFVSSTSF